MVCLLEKALVEGTCALILALALLEVDVRFPQEFRHIELRLFDSQFEDSARTVKVVKASFEFSKLDPCLCIGAVELNILCVELSASCELEKLHLELNVAFEKLVFRTHANCLAEKLAGGCKLRLANFKVCKH